MLAFENKISAKEEKYAKEKNIRQCVNMAHAGITTEGVDVIRYGKDHSDDPSIELTKEQQNSADPKGGSQQPHGQGDVRKPVEDPRHYGCQKDCGKKDHDFKQDTKKWFHEMCVKGGLVKTLLHID